MITFGEETPGHHPRDELAPYTSIHRQRRHRSLLQPHPTSLRLGNQQIGQHLVNSHQHHRTRLNSALHFAERHGLIIIVALGESIVSIGIGFAALPISWPIIVASALGVSLRAE